MDSILLNRAKRHFRKSDKVMARLIEKVNLTLSKSSRPHYHSLVRAIISQQLSVKAAATIEKRLLIQHGGRYFNAGTILKLKATTMRECGISHKKIHYIHTLANAVVNGELNFRSLAKQDDDTVSNTLTQYPGIGPWSADMFLINSLRRPNIFPIGDLVIRQSMQHHYQLADDTKHDKYISIANVWQPYRTIASFYLWKTRPKQQKIFLKTLY